MIYMESGYSGTPLPKKLNLPAEGRLLMLDVPESIRARLGLSAQEVEVTISGGEYDWMLVSATSRAAVEDLFPKLKDRLVKKGCLWISWPKKASGMPTDLNENIIRDIGLATGLVDTKVCAVDDTWSGLKFMWRLADR